MTRLNSTQNELLTLEKIGFFQQSYFDFERQAFEYAKFIPGEDFEAVEKNNADLEAILLEQDDLIEAITSLNIGNLEEAKALMKIWFKLAMLVAGDEEMSVRDKIALIVFRYLKQ